MRNIRELLKPFSKDGRATARSAPPSTLSENTNTSPSNLTERHVHPDMPAQAGSMNHGAQLVIRPTAQAIPSAPGASLAHTAQSHVPHTAPPVADHLSGPDPQAAERQRPSCWDQAAKCLQSTQPHVHKELEKIKSGQENRSQSEPEDLLKLAESKMRQTRGIPGGIETTIRFILQFKEVVTAAANFDPHKIVPIVWRGFCVVLEACLGESTQLREELRVIEAITSKLGYWANVESLFLGTVKNNILNKFEPLESKLIKLYLNILVLEVKLVNWASSGSIAQVFKTQERKATWEDLVKNINTSHEICKDTFDKCKIRIDQYGKVKKWISEYRPEQAHDDALQRTGVDRKYRECGRWLLDDPRFTSWSPSEAVSGSQILWLRGTTGTGKSTLLARIIQWHLDRASMYPGRRFAYFYCSRGTDLSSKHSYKSVLQALLRQAAYDQTKGEISTPVLNAYISAGGDSDDLQPLSFTKCEILLHRILESGIKLRIMIDALDECDDPMELLKALRGPSGVMPDRLELLVSSRYEVHVNNKLPNAIIVDLGKSVPDTDMITYITTEVKYREKDERILEGEYPDLEDRLIEILCKRAGGMFRWVQLQLSLFFNPNNTSILYRDTLEKRLKELSTGSVAGQKDLNKAYHQIFERNTDKMTLEHRHASKIYKMLLCNRRPLSMAAVTTAVAFDEDKGFVDERITQKHVRQLTQDFIIETERGTLEFAHVSVKDYLQGEHHSDYSDSKCHAQVALTCLKYISSQDWLVSVVERQSNGFLRYSDRYWGEHCAQLSKEDRQSLGVSKELLSWMIEGAGSTTFQDWLQAGEKFRRSFTRPSYSDSGSPVFSACDWNLVEVLENLLLENPAYDLNLSPDHGGLTPLLLASSRGHKIIVKLLLEKGAKVEAADLYGRTPLHKASERGHVEVVKLLLEKGAKIEAADQDRGTPLYQASGRGHIKVVKLLLEKGAKIEAATKIGGETPLHWASGSGHVEVVKLLLEKGAKVEATDKDGETPLHWASESGHVEVVKLLSNTT